MIRKKALLEAGGWQADTLAEDLDASYRIQNLAYRILYLNDLHSPGDIPPTVPSFKKQQARWTCGSLRTARKLLPTMWANQAFDLKQRLQAFIHLTSYMFHPMMFASFVLTCLATFLQVDSFRVAKIFSLAQLVANFETRNTVPSFEPHYLAWGMVGMLILICTFAAWIPPILTLRAQALPVSRKLSSFLLLFLLGCGVSLSNTIEAGKALLSNRDWVFQRTPKYAIQQDRGEWRDKRYQVQLDFVSLLELLFVCLGASAIGFAIWRSNFGVLLILVPFTAAYAYVSMLAILQSRGGRAA